MHINLVAIHPGASPQAVPLANAFLKSFAGDSSVEVNLKEFFAGQSPAEIASELCSTNPSAVGFSMYLWNRAICEEVASEIRKSLPELLVFAGGPEVTADPKGVIASGVFSFVITGEGEAPFASLCERLSSRNDLTGIKGLILPGDDPCSSALPIQDLDTIPSPFLGGILDIGNYSGILWQLARGCSFACDFCFDARGNRSVRRFSLERIEAELIHFAEGGVSQIFVLDSTFNQDAKRAKQILRLIRKIAPRIHFHFEVRSEFIDQEMAQLFASITCSLQIGLQSADPDVLKRVGRSFNRQDFSRRTGFLNNSGAVFGFDLIYGLPGDTLEGFCKSLDFALSLYPNHLDIFPLAVLPGTKLAECGNSSGLIWTGQPPYTLISSPTFSVQDLAYAGRIAKACDIFFTRGRAVAWFNSVIEALHCKPSFFFKIFESWLSKKINPDLSEPSFEDDEILAMQEDFLKHIFQQKKLAGLLPVVMDLLNYHHHYAKALLAAQPVKFRTVRSRDKISAIRFKLASSASLTRFNYEIQEVLECGAPDLVWMVRNLDPVRSCAVIYPNHDCVCTETLDDSFFTLLQQMNGNAVTGDIIRKLGLNLAETHDFLIFCQEEGIILPV